MHAACVTSVTADTCMLGGREREFGKLRPANKVDPLQGCAFVNCGRVHRPCIISNDLNKSHLSMTREKRLQ